MLRVAGEHADAGGEGSQRLFDKQQARGGKGVKETPGQLCWRGQRKPLALKSRSLGGTSPLYRSSRSEEEAKAQGAFGMVC